MITIVGNGAMGSLLQTRCQQLNIEYQVMLKPNRSPVTRAQGIIELNNSQCQTVSESNLIDDGLVILPLKAYQIEACAQKLQLGSSVCLVLLHNGMGTHDQVAAHFPNNPIIVATTSWGAYKSDKDTLMVTGIGKTQAGWLQKVGPSRVFEQQFESLLPPTTWHENIIEVLWKKLAINAVINPLTAINDIKNGELLAAEYLPYIQQISAEIAAVMEKLDIQTSPDNLVNTCMQVAQDTANNFSSMHQDTKYKRRTEIDYINGYVASQAKKLGIEVPINTQLWQQIKKMEAN